MIIFGSRTSAKLVATLFLVCHMCQAQVAQRLFRRRTWFTLFFIPIFPFGHGKYIMQCANCGSQTDLTRDGAEQFKRDAEGQAAGRMAAESLQPPAPAVTQDAAPAQQAAPAMPPVPPQVPNTPQQ